MAWRPGGRGEMRTRSDAGRLANRSGGSKSTAEACAGHLDWHQVARLVQRGHAEIGTAAGGWRARLAHAQRRSGPRIRSSRQAARPELG